MKRNPVLLVHGIFRKKTVFNRMSVYLSALGWEVHSFDLKPSNARLGLDKLAEQISAYVTHHFAPNQPIDLVGLSMGGLVSRYYVQRLGGSERVKRFVTIASPHYGTWLAYTLPFIGCVQMRPGSAFLQDLNRDIEILSKVNFTSIWTAYDFVIVPAQNSRLGVGQEIKLRVFAHAMMVRDKKTLQALAQALSLPISN
ncbi:alpha/beta fold hydrolase [Pleurocapsales cyanobacterium LEGE 06147]|nr:alpha/beta fold hydrolase [Pleurocapsales cyanobacterium LEGE 06147]